MIPTVLAVSLSATHSMHKPTRAQIHLRTGLGVEGDAHAGVTVQHRSRDPQLPSSVYSWPLYRASRPLPHDKKIRAC